MSKRILTLSTLLGLVFYYSSFNTVKLFNEEQMPKVLSPARLNFKNNLTNLYAEEQMPKILTIKYSA